MLGRIDQGPRVHKCRGSRPLNVYDALPLLAIWPLHVYHKARRRLLTVLHRGRVNAAFLRVQALLLRVVVNVLSDDNAAALLKLLEDAYGVFLVLLHLLLLHSVPSLLLLDLAGFLIEFAVERRLLSTTTTLSVRKQHKRLLLLLLIHSLIMWGVAKLVHLNRWWSYLWRLNHAILLLLRYHLWVLSLPMMISVAVKVEDYTALLAIIASGGDTCRGDVTQLRGGPFNEFLGLLLQEVVLLLLQGWLDVQLLLLLLTSSNLRHRDSQRGFATPLLEELVRCLICDRAHRWVIRSLTLLLSSPLP